MSDLPRSNQENQNFSAPTTQGQKPVLYHDFPISLSDLGQNGAYRVRVNGQTPGGEMPEGEYAAAKYDPQAMATDLSRLSINEIKKEALVRLGKTLSEMLLPGAVGELFQEAFKAARAQGDGLRIQVRSDEASLALTRLPWEVAYLDRPGPGRLQNDFLALSRYVSITRYAAFGPPLAPVPAKDRYRIFIALAGPTAKNEKLDLSGDRKAILRAVQAVKQAGHQVDPVLADPVTRLKILNGAGGSDIFHFGGHGDFAYAYPDPTSGEMINTGRIYLGRADDGEAGEEVFDSETFARLVGNLPVRMVVLGACKSAEVDGRNNWLGMAPALVRENIPAVLGMQYKVGDLNAARFFAAFYRLVLDGFSVDEAVFEGRQAVATQAGLQDRDWGTPVLYLRARDGVLFKPAPQPVQPPVQPRLPGIRMNIGHNEGTVRAISVGETSSAGAAAISSLSLSLDMELSIVTNQGIVEGVHIDKIVDR